jgi:hypothetical protein
VPFLLEAGVKQHVNALGGDVVGGAASRRHVVLGVSEG